MRRLFVLLLVAGLSAGLCGAAWAQEVTGSISGTVTDSSGAAVAGAKVTIKSLDKNVVVRTLTAEASGQYLAAYLPVGRYEVVAEAPNFKKSVYSNIVLNVADKLTINLALEVGSVNESVTVEANPLQVELQSVTAGGLINGTQVRELALNGRNWEQLVTLTPGVSDGGNSDTLYVGAFAPQGTNLVTFSMNGGRREQNNYMIDGADNVDRGSNLTLLSFPSVDSIAEFRVIRGQYDPEYGRAASGQVNTISEAPSAGPYGSPRFTNRRPKPSFSSRKKCAVTSRTSMRPRTCLRVVCCRVISRTRFASHLMLTIRVQPAAQAPQSQPLRLIPLRKLI